MAEDAGRHLMLVGCGRMGSAMLDGWLSTGALAQVTVVEPNPAVAQAYADQPTVQVAATLAQVSVPLGADAILLAVKPQMMADVLDALAPVMPQPRPLVLSVAAGSGIGLFERALGPGPVVRIMPNTPAAVGKGMSVLCANTACTADQRAFAEALMTSVGCTAWIETEAQMDAVTAISGSGPAYVFHLIEAMAVAGERLGLPAEVAMTLARQTVIGAAALAEAQPNTTAEALREAVTSPGGTTAAALSVLARPEALAHLVTQAAQAAAKRSAELA